MKKSITTLLLLFFIQFSVSQTAIDYYNEYVKYNDLGDYQNAVVCAEKALQAQELEVGKDNANYGYLLRYLAELYEKTNQYYYAIAYLKEYVVRTKTLEKAPYDMILVKQVELIRLLNSIGRIEEAGNIINEAINIIQTENSIKDSTKAFVVSYIAEFYTSNGELLNQALIFNKQVVQYYKKYEPESLNYYLSKYQLGLTYYRLEEYDKAATIIERILINYKKASQLSIAQKLNILGLVYLEQGKTQKSEKSFKKAINIYKSKKVIDTEAYYELTYNYASLLAKNGKHQQALTYFENYFSKIKENINTNFTFSSQEEKYSFLLQYNDFIQLIESYAHSVKDSSKNNYNRLSLDISNFFKNLILNSTIDVLTQLSEFNDSRTNSLISGYRNKRNKLNRLKLTNDKNEFKFTTNMNKSEKEIYDLRAEINEVENSLNIIYHKYNLNKTNSFNPYTKLKNNETAIEFSSFNYHNGKKWTDSILYVAYLIKKDWQHPKMIPLFEEKQLVSLIEGKKPNLLYKARTAKPISTNTTYYADSIYKLVWKPLEKYIKEGETVFFSPDGLLHQIAFAAIGPKKEELLSKKYHLVQLSSTAKITEKRKEPQKNTTLFIGGVEYDYNSNGKQKKEDTSIINLDIQTLRNSKSNQQRESPWDYLEGTKKEIESLQVQYDTKGIDYLKPLTGADATEENFKKIDSNSPNILHIATHGFFYEKLENEEKNTEFSIQTTNPYKLAEDPLLRSGLVLAGANYAWEHGSNPYEKEDGILTALEISNMDLSNTDMVILSACETGLGDIDGSEGVYGLQRAFKMAGVDIIIMTLWSIPDEETPEFMNLFYKEWLANNDVRKAFNDTQKVMQNKYKDEPEKWAGFVMFE